MASYYVSNAGNNGFDGSLENPWLTISYALTQSVPGDIIYIRGGTYYESLYINQGRANQDYLTIKNYPGETPIIIPRESSIGWINVGTNLWKISVSTDSYDFYVYDNYNFYYPVLIKENNYGIHRVLTYNELEHPNIDFLNPSLNPSDLNTEYDLFFSELKGSEIEITLLLAKGENPNVDVDIYIVDYSDAIRIFSPNIEVNGLTIRYAAKGIVCSHLDIGGEDNVANNVRILNNTIERIAVWGINEIQDNVYIYNNTIRHCGRILKYESTSNPPSSYTLTNNNLDHCVYSTGTNGIIENNTIEDSYGYELHPWGEETSPKEERKPQNYIIRNNFVKGGFVISGGGHIIYNNIIVGDRDISSMIYSFYINTPYKCCQVYNNIFIGKSGIFVGTDNDKDNEYLEIRNNIIKILDGGERTLYLSGDTDSYKLSNNLYYGLYNFYINGSVYNSFDDYLLFMNSIELEIGTINSKPLFLNEPDDVKICSATDYMSVFGAPQIDAGFMEDNINYSRNPSYIFFNPYDINSTDFNGNNRVIGGVVDIGPFEYQQNPSEGDPSIFRRSSSSSNSSSTSSSSNYIVYTKIYNGNTINISKSMFLEFVSVVNNTATLIIAGKSFLIKNKDGFLEFDTKSVIKKFVFTEIKEEINRKINNIEFKVTYLGTGSLLFSVEIMENISKDNFIFIYRLNDSNSLELARYYASKYNMSIVSKNTSVEIGKIEGISWEVTGQLIGIECSNNEILYSEEDFNREVLNPIKNAIENSVELLNRTIWGIIVGFNVPGGFIDDEDVISTTSRLSRINHTFSKKTNNKLFNRSIFKRFDEDDAEFSLICSRIDAPTLEIAKNFIDNSDSLRKQNLVNGTIYVDPYSDRAGPTAEIYKNDILEFYNNLLTELGLNNWSTSFLDPYIDVGIPYVENDSFVWSWFTDRASLDFFEDTNNSRVFFYNADHDGGYTIRDINSNRWPFLSMKEGYSSSAGATSDPTNTGFLNPTAFFKSLKNGSTIGEAYLFSLPYLDWTMTLFGDPLVVIKFPGVEQDNENEIEENESWRRMSVDLAKVAAYLYKKEQDLYDVVKTIVDFTSINSSAASSLLIPANDLYKTNNETIRNAKLKSLTERFFNYPQKRISTITSIDDYLSSYNFKISKLLSTISSDIIISDENLLDEGWWRFEFNLQDEDKNNYINYHFKLKVYTDICYSIPAFDYEIDSYFLENWTYEKEKDVFEDIPISGIFSGIAGRRIRYESTKDEYLNRGETYYFEIIQYNIDTGKQFLGRRSSDIIWT